MARLMLRVSFGVLNAFFYVTLVSGLVFLVTDTIVVSVCESHVSRVATSTSEG